MGEEEGEEARERGGVTTSDPIFIAMQHVNHNQSILRRSALGFLWKE